MEAWYKKLGYYNNPFILDPFKEKTSWIGDDQVLKDTVYYVRSGSLIFVQGPRGSGKTKLLKSLVDSFKGKIIYVNATRLRKTLNVEELLRNKLGLRGKLFGAKPVDMILFLDNASELSKVNFERIKYYYDQGFLQSVVFTGVDIKKSGFSESMISRIGKRIIQLPSLQEEDAMTIVAKRLGEDINDEDALIGKDHIKKIYAVSKKNHRLFLINAHRVFEELGFDGDDRIETKHLDVLKDKLEKSEEEEFEVELQSDFVPHTLSYKDESGNPIIEIGDYYRNPAVDMFCSNCGAIVEPDETVCPECESEFEIDTPSTVEKKNTNKRRGDK
jgi:replication-associated recombination protein RarA